MLISICIPHFERLPCLLVVLDSIRAQDHADIEVLIADDESADGSATAIPGYIGKWASRTHVAFHYLGPRKVGYDRNLRAAMAAAKGEYLLLLGNDDALASPSAVRELAEALRRLDAPDAAFTEFCAFDDCSQIAGRARETRVVGAGPQTAARYFRSFSFLGGLVFKRAAFERHDSAEADDSTFYQMYLGARIVAAGGRLASVSAVIVAKDVSIEGQRFTLADGLRTEGPTLEPCAYLLDQAPAAACMGILPQVPEKERPRYLALIYGQIMAFNYPFWLFEFRRIGVPRASLRLVRGCRPDRLLKGSRVGPGLRLRLFSIYLLVTPLGLLLPVWLLSRAAPSARALSRAIVGNR